MTGGTKKSKSSGKHKKPSKRGQQGVGKRKGKGDRQRDDAPAAAAAVQDDRFAAASNRPQFHVSSSERDSSAAAASGLLVGGSGSNSKVTIDERFASALTDPRFRIGGETGVDRYGRKKKKEKKKKGKKAGGEEEVETNEELGRFYTVAKGEETKGPKEEEDDEEEDDDIGSGGGSDGESSSSSGGSSSDESSTSDSGDEGSGKGRKQKKAQAADVDNGGAEEDDEANDPAARIAYLTALSRGEIEASSSSDDDSSTSSASSDDGDSDDDDSSSSESVSQDGPAGILDPSTKRAEESAIEITDEPSQYLAVCNMDWSSVRAVDLLGILASFSPPGSVRRVRVYPSDFGLERSEKDAVLGPVGIWKDGKDEEEKEMLGGDSDDDDDSDDGEEEKAQETLSDGGDDDDSNDSRAGKDGDRDSEDEQDDEEEDPDLLDDAYDHFSNNPNADPLPADNDFDQEKLRAYEASKMKYYFAVAEFTSPQAADAAYREVDGMEVGHSSATIDLRSIPPSDIRSVTDGRTVRDECTAMPSNYEPPDFVVAALQQTAVRCTWEDGDAERERKLTRYGVGDEAWAAMTEGDDLKAYLASDGSSDEEESGGEEDGDDKGRGAKMRALLGLGSDDEAGGGGTSEESASEGDSGDDDNDDGADEENQEGEGEKEFTYIPGKGLEDKIRNKLESKKAGDEKAVELSPWEKYQQKRKEKRKERRKAIRSRRKDKLPGADGASGGGEDDGMYGEDPEFGVPDSDDEGGDGGGDDFFLGEGGSKSKKKNKRGGKAADRDVEAEGRVPSTKEELELLIAGDNDQEAERDFDMRGIVRIEKVKGKKLRGSRKRKEADLAADVSGADFRIDTADSRFAAVLEGGDERFGIDRTDPNYKDTPAMQAVLAEQSKRRKAKKRAKVAVGRPDVSADAVNKTNAPSGGALALSSLVKSLKTKVAKNKKR